MSFIKIKRFNDVDIYDNNPAYPQPKHQKKLSKVYDILGRNHIHYNLYSQT